MDIEAFLNRIKCSKADLLRQLGLDPKSSLISSYIAGRANPSHDICCKLIDCGITAQELFGDELGSMLVKNSLSFSRSSEFQEGLQVAQKPMTRDEVIALFKSMKEKGEI